MSLPSDQPVENTREPSAVQPKPARTCLFILGMHRSGTSSIAGVFAKLGATPPTNLVGATEANPAGHWESLPFALFHDELLASAGSRWDDWRQFKKSWNDTPAAAAFRSRGRQLLRQEFGDSSLFVFKDPRNCRLAEFWFDIFNEQRISPKVILPIRSPLEVAQSHQARDGFSIRKGLLLWLRHVLDAELSSRNTPRIVIEWNDFLNDWDHIVSLIESFTGPFPETGDRRSAKRFLQIELKRQHVSDADLVAHSATHEWISDAYQALRELKHDPESSSALARLDCTRNKFNDACQIFGSVLADSDLELSRMQGEHAELKEIHVKTVEKSNALHVELSDLRDRFETSREKERSLADELMAVTAEAEAAKKLAELTTSECAAEVLRLHNSYSWRVTGPFRRIGALFHKLRAVRVSSDH